MVPEVETTENGSERSAVERSGESENEQGI